jgi:hypothetical protein
MFPALVRQGPHAYGWATWDGAGIDVVKYEGRCDTPEAIATMDLNPASRWIIAHTRYATHGSPSDMRNNHPLEHGDFIGVHNGVLRNYAAILAETGRQDPATEVDSEAIFAAVNKWGHRAGLRRVEGDMVTVYTDVRKPHVVHIARSHGRQLYYARTKAGSLIWASEQQAIEATGLELAGGFSELGRNRLIRVKEGRVCERITFRTEEWKRFEGATALEAPRPQAPDRWTPKNAPRHPVKGMTDWMAELKQEKQEAAEVVPLSKAEERRAKKLKRRRQQNTKGPLVRETGGAVHVTDVHGRKLVYYKGMLLTEDEYEDEVLNEMRMAWEW